MHIIYDKYKKGVCPDCKMNMLVNPETGLCLICENIRLTEAVSELKERIKKSNQIIEQQNMQKRAQQCPITVVQGAEDQKR